MLETTSSMLKAALAELSDSQREAAEWSRGPLLVLAGPGSGKTRVLTARIARILDSTRDRPFRILGLTFTNKAADEMRVRVERLVPGQERRLFLGTFHSFCADVLRQHGVHVGIKPDYRIYSSTDDIAAIMQEAVAKASRVNGSVLPTDTTLQPIIDNLRALLVSPEEVPARLHDQELAGRVMVVYQAYEEQLKAANALDFNSLLYHACELFGKYPALGKQYRTVYQYWCVDEFQDTNHAQYTLLKLMAGGVFREVFVVADDDQIIYQWNGASYQRIENLISDFQPQVLQLPVNYRCPAEVVDLANRLISHNLLRTRDKEPLQAVRERAPVFGSVIRISVLDSDRDEAEFVAADIADRHRDDLGRVAVLGRNRSLLEGVKGALQSQGIRAVIAQRRDSFASAPFIWMHSCLRQSNNRVDARNLESLVGSFNQISGLEISVSDLVATARAKHGDLLREWADTTKAQAVDTDVREAAVNVSELLVQGADYKGFVDRSLAWFRKLAPDSGTQEQFAGFSDDLRVWTELSKDIRASLGVAPSLQNFLQELDLRSKEPPADASTVTLMTIHGAKGKEFDHVYLIGLAEDVIPSFQSKRRGDRSPEMEEERRNCFVAITRAQKTLTLTRARKYHGWAKEPSRFIREMGLAPGRE